MRSPELPHTRKLLYVRRLERESEVPEETIVQRMRWDMPILAQNMKCSVSLDLPLANCKPTSVCASVCYAAQGRQSYTRAVIKSLAVNRMVLEQPDRAALKIVGEAGGQIIRLAGSGELLPDHKPCIDAIEFYGGSWWGFTRRLDTHLAMPRLMFSIDSTSPGSIMRYVEDRVPVERRAYLRRPRDPPAPIEVAVTFPVHGSQTRYADQVPLDETDCPVTRHEISGCGDCRRCY